MDGLDYNLDQRVNLPICLRLDLFRLRVFLPIEQPFLKIAGFLLLLYIGMMAPFMQLLRVVKISLCDGSAIGGCLRHTFIAFHLVLFLPQCGEFKITIQIIMAHGFLLVAERYNAQASVTPSLAMAGPHSSFTFQAEEPSC